MVAEAEAEAVRSIPKAKVARHRVSKCPTRKSRRMSRVGSGV